MIKYLWTFVIRRDIGWRRKKGTREGLRDDEKRQQNTNGHLRGHVEI